MSDPVHDAGMAVRRKVLGDAHVDQAIERTTDFTAPFQDFIAWGSVWTREGLDRRIRRATITDMQDRLLPPLLEAASAIGRELRTSRAAGS